LVFSHGLEPALLFRRTICAVKCNDCREGFLNIWIVSAVGSSFKRYQRLSLDQCQQTKVGKHAEADTSALQLSCRNQKPKARTWMQPTKLLEYSVNSSNGVLLSKTSRWTLQCGIASCVRSNHPDVYTTTYCLKEVCQQELIGFSIDRAPLVQIIEVPKILSIARSEL
jgi:hypothetical protein